MTLIMRGRLRFAAVSAAAIVGALASATGAAADPAPPFKDLLTQAQANAPRLAEAAAGVRQAEGLARQAGARPNPTAGVTVENFSGKGIYSGTNNAETTFQLSQPLEVGGKRDARVAAVVWRWVARGGGVDERAAVLVERRVVHVPSRGSGVVCVADPRRGGGRHACDGARQRLLVVG